MIDDLQDDLKAKAMVVARQLQGILKSPCTSNKKKGGKHKSDADTPWLGMSGSLPQEHRSPASGVVPQPNNNNHVLDKICISAVGQGRGDQQSSTTELLDSHANMVVIGVCSTIIEDTGLHADVSGFTQELTCNKIPIVDAAVAYDCPYSFETYLLVWWRMHYIYMCPAWDTTLSLLFIMREAGLKVNETLKIHATNIHPRTITLSLSLSLSYASRCNFRVYSPTFLLQEL